MGSNTTILRANRGADGMFGERAWALVPGETKESDAFGSASRESSLGRSR